MSEHGTYLDCGCYIRPEGGRSWCPTCLEPPREPLTVYHDGVQWKVGPLKDMPKVYSEDEAIDWIEKHPEACVAVELVDAQKQLAAEKARADGLEKELESRKGKPRASGGTMSEPMTTEQMEAILDNAIERLTELEAENAKLTAERDSLRAALERAEEALKEIKDQVHWKEDEEWDEQLLGNEPCSYGEWIATKYFSSKGK